LSNDHIIGDADLAEQERLARRQLLRAQARSGQHYRDGSAPDPDPEKARADLRRIRDIRKGLQMLSALEAHATLSREIERLQNDHEELSARLPELKQRAHQDRGLVEGTGSVLAARLREQREAQATAFDEYQRVHNRYLDLGPHIAELVARRDALQHDNPDAFEMEEV
jgi:hypothetical protein